MNIETHKKISSKLVGIPIRIEEGVESEVTLKAIDEMTVDEYGLIHGGFTYGLADYAAMLAVNHPFVVLGGSESKFLAPVRVGDTMRALAKINEASGRKRVVSVDVFVGETKVFEGQFKCYVLEKHVFTK